MLTILITGGIGAGKSWVIDWLKRRSQFVFQADNQAKKLLKTDSICYSQLRELFFESELYLPNGEFDRKKLAQKIFQDLKKRKAMEAIIHPLVRRAFKEFVEELKKKGVDQVFYEAPLISKSILKFCDKKILITCPISIRRQRLFLKGWTESDIENRLLGQIPAENIKNQVDFIIDNSGDFKNLKSQLNTFLLWLKK